jgi:hypothetical protein
MGGQHQTHEKNRKKQLGRLSNESKANTIKEEVRIDKTRQDTPPIKTMKEVPMSRELVCTRVSFPVDVGEEKMHLVRETIMPTVAQVPRNYGVILGSANGHLRITFHS